MPFAVHGGGLGASPTGAASYKLHLFGTVPGNLARVEESKALGWRFFAGESVGHRLLLPRARNAVAWLNQNKTDQMRNAIRSMPERLEALVELKGAMTGY